MAMGQERIGKAFERIEAALARLDSAADRLSSGPPAGDAIAAAKKSLKDDLAGALGDLDALIESIEQ